MKKTLGHLPKEKKEELKAIVKFVTEEIPETEMIILFGSYARGDYVDYDQRTEFGVNTFYMSDYDLMVLYAPGQKRDVIKGKLHSITNRFQNKKHFLLTTPISFECKSILEFNKAIETGKYFYTDIKKEGILLFDKGNYKISRIKKLEWTEIRNIAECFLKEKLEMADGFLLAFEFFLGKQLNRLAAFNLHQAAENLLHMIAQVYSLYSPKEHNLSALFKLAKRYSDEPGKIFIMSNPQDVHLFNLLEKAYVEGRYNAHFQITQEELKILQKKILSLRDIAIKLCKTRISEYEQNISGEKRKVDIEGLK